MNFQPNNRDGDSKTVCFLNRLPNGWRYPLVGGTRQRHFNGTNLKPKKLPENAPTPTSRVHAVLGSSQNSRRNTG